MTGRMTTRPLPTIVIDMEGGVKGCEEMAHAVIMLMGQGVARGLTPDDCRAVDRVLHHLLDYASEARSIWEEAAQASVSVS